MTTKPRSKWDVPPRRGEYDHLLKEIRDEMERVPPPPDEPPRPPRVTVNIELVDRRQQSPSRSRRPAVFLWVIVLTILAIAFAHAETTRRTDPPVDRGYTTRDFGDGVARTWSNDQRAGHFHGCDSYKLSGTVYTNCY